MAVELQQPAQAEECGAASSHRVLIVGASAGEWDFLATTLGHEGLVVEALPAPAELDRRYRRNGFQIAICSTGELPRIRELTERDDVYVIAMGAGEEIGESLSAGADDFLSLPLDPHRVRARVNVARRVHALRDAVLRRNATLTETNRKLERTNRRMQEELQAAVAVQRSLLPAAEVKLPGLRVGWRLRPCQELAGDILNCFRLDEHHVAFYVLDVSGHGVSAALLSVQVSRLMSPILSEGSFLKESLKQPPWYRVVEPARVAASLNQAFQTTSANTKYFTMVYGTLHVESGRLRLASAGQPSPLLVSAEGVTEEITCRGLPIGFFPRATFGSYETILRPGTRLWLYSDGITEATDGQARMLGTAALSELVTRYADRSPQQAVDRIIEAVEAWSAPGGPADDCSLLSIERRPGGAPRA